MTREQLFAQIQQKRSFLCIGLDTDPAKIPAHLHSAADPVLEFNRQIIDATHDLCVAYKPNLAFYESLGPKGWETLAQTLDYIPEGLFTIADAKRGDIGNTSSMYAKAFFETLGCDAVTVAPYMGEDSVTPFLNFEGKWVIMLALTSNAGSLNFQMLELQNRELLFEKVIRTAQKWGSADQLMYVVGATQTTHLRKVRELAPDHFLLVPGIGAQGGDLEAVARFGMNRQCGLLVNASRSILYAGRGKDFAQQARAAAQQVQQQMAELLERHFSQA
ncbi:orotidine-5'-phosphate decarboxylase [Catalinimonas alkaloidigena]|uniref:Orotidine-5'-phosphate decarboxylase n=1 Tax=Catalinimonas alkaloidigena TaxID=1075417 RepID=A0A1G9DCN0_9BACT|nr:orotidine-5'-phosphate decarboxylase [Catalinimonas alkaloidigena]SDK61668.1 orotidine-5'-phosphate decarboxylase [Catalinimonas alkaloidigena]